MADVLENILDFRRKSLAESKAKASLSELETQAKAIPLNSFQSALSKDKNISVIAEMKKKSPSAGILKDPYDVTSIATAYEKGGASALSVLTESDFFSGDIADIRKVKSSTSLPILRKDFVFDPYQIVEAKAYGADAVLLIADMIDPSELKELMACADQFKIDALVEVFTPDVVPTVLSAKAQIVGINTRNLRTLEMKPENIFSIAGLIPNDRIVVAESGIKGPEDLEKLKAHPIAAALIGESFLKKDNLQEAVQNMVKAGYRK